MLCNKLTKGKVIVLKSMETLEKMYNKELELAEKHKQNALDIKKEMELRRGHLINKKANALNLNGAEYDQFIRLLEKDKKTLLDAIELVLGDEKGDEKYAQIDEIDERKDI